MTQGRESRLLHWLCTKFLSSSVQLRTNWGTVDSPVPQFPSPYVLDIGTGETGTDGGLGKC